MNALKFSVLVLADEIAAGSIGLSPLDAALVFWHGSSPTVEYHLLQVRRPGAVENCKILLLSGINEMTKIQSISKGIAIPTSLSVSLTADCLRSRALKGSAATSALFPPRGIGSRSNKPHQLKETGRRREEGDATRQTPALCIARQHSAIFCWSRWWCGSTKSPKVQHEDIVVVIGDKQTAHRPTKERDGTCWGKLSLGERGA